jgi:hypothetical protein
MIEGPTQHPRIVLEVSNVRAMILIKPDNDDTIQEITNTESDDPSASSLISDIEEDALYNRQEVLQLDEARCDTTICSTRVPLPQKQNSA